MKPIIEVHHLTKRFRLGELGSYYHTLRDVLSFTSVKKSKHKHFVTALENISFEVYPGETIGIIGRNGSGKTTLLKILSQITYPDEGFAILRGRIGALLEVGTGFHGELTGRENVFFNGALLGLTKKEIKAKFDEIVAFAGVEEFIDTPLKHYSSGMQLRLAFAVASHLNPEILAIDEVLAIGDAEFQQKTLNKMNDVAQAGRTVLFVSHNMATISAFCKRTLILDKGKLVNFGPTEEMVRQYLKMLEVYVNQQALDDDPSLPFQVISVKAVDTDGAVRSEFAFSEPISFIIDVKIREQIPTGQIVVVFYNQYKHKVFSEVKDVGQFSPGVHKFKLQLPVKMLAPGTFSVGVESVAHLYGNFQIVDHAFQFTVIDDGTKFALSNLGSSGGYGDVILPCTWEKL